MAEAGIIAIMDTRYLLLLVLAIANIPLFWLLLRFLAKRGRGVKFPISELISPKFLKDQGGEMKILLALFTTALLVYFEAAGVLALLRLFSQRVGS